MGTSHSTRFTPLDGLRGWAALSVLVTHFTWETFGTLFPELRSYPVAVLCNDTLAVSIFFVLSGYVLTRYRWGRANGLLAGTLAARYLRLALPIAAVTSATLVIVAFGWNANRAAAAVVSREDWLGQFLPFTASPAGAAWFATIGVFTSINRGTYYNPFLWTMIIEFWGSFVILVLSQFRVRAWQPIVLVVLSILLLRFYSIASGMTLGALLALYDVKRPATLRASAFAPLIALGLVLLTGWLKLIDGPQAITMACAVVLVAIAREDNALSRLLDEPLSQWLGYLSFPMYLAQFAILITLTSHLVLMANANGILTVWTALGIALVSIAATLAASYALVPFETATKRLTRLLKSRRVEAAAQLG